jgi:ketosteroid isomerase-like protein
MNFEDLLKQFTAAANSGSAEDFGACFTEDAVYHDYIYGPFHGRANIGKMLAEVFHGDAEDFQWEMVDPVCDGERGYAAYNFSFTSTIPAYKGKRVALQGMSQFTLRDGLIAEYHEAINGGIAMAQLGVPADTMARVFRRNAEKEYAKPALASHKRPA